MRRLLALGILAGVVLLDSGVWAGNVHTIPAFQSGVPYPGSPIGCFSEYYGSVTNSYCSGTQYWQIALPWNPDMTNTYFVGGAYVYAPNSSAPVSCTLYSADFTSLPGHVSVNVSSTVNVSVYGTTVNTGSGTWVPTVGYRSNWLTCGLGQGASVEGVSYGGASSH